MKHAWRRVQALFLHSWYHMSHSKESQVDLIWFPMIQFVIFGLIARILSQESAELGQMLLLGFVLWFVLWEVVNIGRYCVTVSMLWELWSKSFNTLFITPLSMKEWLISQMLSGVVKSAAVIASLAVVGQLFFNFSLLSLGFMFFIYSIILIFSRTMLGYLSFITALIIRFGTNIQSFAWGLIYVLQPFSAVFYPLKRFLCRSVGWGTFHRLPMLWKLHLLNIVRSRSMSVVCLSVRYCALGTPLPHCFSCIECMTVREKLASSPD